MIKWPICVVFCLVAGLAAQLPVLAVENNSSSLKDKNGVQDKLDGTWQGALDVGHGMKLPLVFNFKHLQSGKLGADMLSPSQSKQPIEVDQVASSGRQVIIKVAPLTVQFVGELSDDGDTIDGTFTQAGVDFTLKLKRTAAYEAPRKKQDPVKPYPYNEKEVTFKNGDVTLAGTLTYPKDAAKPLPAVILICGSGPHDRNEEIFYHKPFLVIADYLSRRGFAVLRYDKRGNGASTGKYVEATCLDFAADAEAAYKFLKTQSFINPQKIGLIGHSEGGLIAPIVASKEADVAFIVSLAGSAVSGERILISQNELLAKAAGESAEKTKSDVARAARVYAIIKSESDDTKALAKLAAEADPEASKTERDDFMHSMHTLIRPWYRSFISLDPAPYWRQVHCPVLALNGEKDLQVDPGLNIPAIQKSLAEAGNKNLTTQIIPGVNHLFQHCTTGSPKEYADIEETFSPDVLKIIGDWLAATTDTLPSH